VRQAGRNPFVGTGPSFIEFLCGVDWSAQASIECTNHQMTVPSGVSADCTHILPTRKNPLSPKKLLLSKWTTVSPTDKEKHFVVTRVVEPDPPAVRVEWVVIEAIHSRRASMLRWRDLTEGKRWRQGWV
jgi:tryptophan-rich hypothetical protein